MPEIKIEQSTYERLQRYAKPFTDTPDTVIIRALDALDRVEQVVETEIKSGAEAERRVDPRALPVLTHTKVLDAAIDGEVVSKPNWNLLLDEMLRRAKARAGSYEKLRQICPVNMVKGRKEDEGYSYLPEIDISVQGQDANGACRALVIAAQSLGMSLDIGFMWRLKEFRGFPWRKGASRCGRTHTSDRRREPKAGSMRAGQSRGHMPQDEISPNIAPLFRIVTHDQLAELRDKFSGARPHPLSALLGDLRQPSQTATNTAMAAEYVIDGDPAWIGGIKNRILDTTDPANAASALAELRAYGGLLEAGFVVKPGTGKGKPKPEFVVDLGQGSQVIVEVHAKQMDKAVQAKLNEHHAATRDALDRFKEELRAKEEAGGVFVGEPVSVAPFGEPDSGKARDTVTANAISRLCAIKASEHQLQQDGVANVLWLDLQDDYSWGLGLEPSAAQPLASWKGVLVSGALWYALYGWKGAPIMEFDSMWDHRQKITPMGHDGRFGLGTKVSAVIASFPETTVILEHQSPTVPLPGDFRMKAMSLPWARAEFSICEWEPGLVAAIVNAQERMIVAAATAAGGEAYVHRSK